VAPRSKICRDLKSDTLLALKKRDHLKQVLRPWIPGGAEHLHRTELWDLET